MIDIMHVKIRDASTYQSCGPCDRVGTAYLLSADRGELKRSPA